MGVRWLSRQCSVVLYEFATPADENPDVIGCPPKNRAAGTKTTPTNALRVRRGEPSRVLRDGHLFFLVVELFLDRDLQQLTHRATQDRHLIGFGQPGCCEDLIHWSNEPRVRKVSAKADLSGSDYGDQMPQSLRGENDRIEVDLLQI